MKELKLALKWLIVGAVLLLGLSSLKPCGFRVFIGDLSQNLFSEVVGLALTVAGALYIGYFVARTKLKNWQRL